jgi:phage terminase large subunit
MGLNPLVLRKLKEWKNHPLLFATEAIPGFVPSAQQADLLKNIGRDKRSTVRSGHGTGKDACAAVIITWFMVTRPYAKVICTAPTARQLADILWSEISKWLRKSVVADEFVIQKDKIFNKAAPKEWWCRAVSASAKASKEDQQETLAGFHGDHMLIVVDEASGVLDPVFIPLEGAMTQEDNRCLLIGNPTKNTGYFHDTQFHPEISKKWKKYHWDSRESTNVSKDMVDYFRDKYGEDSNVYRVRVAGEPPLDDANTYIPLSWAMQCVGNDIEVDEDWPIILGVDVARYGEDDSVILPRQGNVILPWERFNGMNTIALARHIGMTFKEMECSYAGIDEIGIGGGVVDWHHDDPLGIGRDQAWGVDVHSSSSDPKKYYRLRDEIWAMMRDNCMRRKYSFPDKMVRMAGMDINIGQELANELAAPTYSLERGPLKIESKKEMKARGVMSPNIADAVGMTEYIKSMAFAQYSVTQKKKKRARIDNRKSDIYPGRASGYGRFGWMVA